MSQDNDQNRPTPSQPWYDNGQVPQSKKFPFGAGNQDDESETRVNPQVDQHGQPPQGGSAPDAQQPPSSAPQAPQYGGSGSPQGGHYAGTPQGGQNYGPPQDGQNYGASQPAAQPYADSNYGSQGQYQQPQHQAPQPNQYQPQAGGYGQPQAGGYGQPQGSQPQPGAYGSPQSGQPQGNQPQHNQPQGNQPQSNQPQGSQPAPQSGHRPQMSDSGSQQFQGILDPHTGEIHPVPDLEGLQDADALLVVVSGPDSGSQILLDTDVVTVGRSPNADIFLDDVTVSRKHAEFIRTPSGFTLRDTGSLNGTYVGRQLIDSIELQNGADVQIGKFRMIFQQRPRA